MPIPTSLKLLLTEAWAWCTTWYDWQSPLCGQIMAQGRLPITHARVDQVFHLSRLPSQYSNLLSWIFSASFGLLSSFWHSSGPFRHLAIIPDPGWSSYLIIEYYLWSCVSGWDQSEYFPKSHAFWPWFFLLYFEASLPASLELLSRQMGGKSSSQLVQNHHCFVMNGAYRLVKFLLWQLVA